MTAISPFIWLCTVSLLARLSYQMARSPVLPRFAQELGAPPELIGLILGASTVTGVFFKLPAGALSDILGRRRMMLLGCLFFAFPPFLYPLVRDPISLLLLRFLHGFATAIFSPVASAFVAELFQKGRGERLGWFASVTEMGSTLGPIAGGYALLYSASFKVTYLLVGILGLLPLIIMFAIPPGSPAPLPNPAGSRLRRFGEGIKEVFSDRSIVIASIMEALMFLGVAALVGFLPLYARGRGLDDGQIGVILGAQLVTAMAGKPITGRISDLVGRKPMIIAGLLLCAITLPAIVSVAKFWHLFALSALFGLGMAIVTPSTTALVADLCRHRNYGSALGAFGTIWDVGEAGGPIIAGIMIARIAYLPAFAIIAFIIILGALIFAISVSDPSREDKA